MAWGRKALTWRWDEGEDVGYVSRHAIIGEPPEHREHRWEVAAGREGYLLPLIAPSAVIEAFATVDSGIDRPTFVGSYAFLMKHSHVGHDAIIGPYSNLAPGAIVGGYCSIGTGAKIGLGASIRPRVTVGPGAVIGAGAVVVRNVPAGEVWAGNPAGRLEQSTERIVPAEWADAQAEYDAWIEWYETAHRGKVRP